MQKQPAAVPARAKQAGDSQATSIRMRWLWAEASVWTERMLQALEDGVKGGVWFSMIDKVYSPSNLQSAWSKAARNKGAAGADQITIEAYEKELEPNLAWLSRQLAAGTYQPRAIRRVQIPKPDGSQRPLGIPTVQDRIVQGAVRHVIEPVFERQFARHSYGFRPGRGCKDALRRVDELLKQGYRYVVDADLKGYFDTIPHQKLMQRVRERIADRRVLKLIEAFLTAKVMEGLEQWTPASGAPQGAVLSPLLSNIYLDPLDHLAEESGYQMTRYADDFVILCKSPQEAELAMNLVKQWVEENGLVLHPVKTRIIDAAKESFEFLGYRFDQGRKWPRDRSMAKLRETIRIKTRPTDGRSLRVVIEDVNRTLRGWFGYFKHSHRAIFREVDGFARRRLRRLLGKRHKRKGIGRSRNDHRRWPNKFFEQMGFYSLVQAHLRLLQPVKAVH
ncbi:MAG TPA: group II intron reverse transcriptase/maturase [Acidobacteriaceae bacterium]|nr:group II intron reverse transcriptase/maturase [Acidobacteriaceae bacterium]